MELTLLDQHCLRNSLLTSLNIKNYERARKDKGGSGLTRLAGLVHQHPDAHFSAVVTSNFNEMLRFSLEFELIYIPLDTTPSVSQGLEEVS